MKYYGNPFYTTYKWRKLRKEVLQTDKNECQDCKAKGIYTKAVHVHHEKPIEKHPELALEKYYNDGAGTHRQLISLCEECHMKRHDYQHKPKEPLTEEKW